MRDGRREASLDSASFEVIAYVEGLRLPALTPVGDRFYVRFEGGRDVCNLVGRRLRLIGFVVHNRMKARPACLVHFLGALKYGRNDAAAIWVPAYKFEGFRVVAGQLVANIR